MKINADGLKLIEHFEGFREAAYQDQRGIWTIGYGHTGPEVHSGLVITQEEANELLALDLNGAEKAVEHLVSVPLTSNRFSALVSFVFNLGAGAFAGSTLRKLINQGHFESAANQFPVWDKVRIKGIPQSVLGLQRRRQAERTLFLKPEDAL